MRTLRLSLVGTVILVLLGGLGGATMAQDEQSGTPDRILIVGNSFTSWNGGIETHLIALAAAEEPPRPIEVDAYTAPGATLKSHFEQLSLTGGVLKKIREGDYDVVILQGDIPELITQSIEPFLEYARLFDQEIKATDGQALFFMAWPYRRLDWVSLDEIVAAHRQVEAELGASVAPVGVAMANSQAERPDLAMLGPDAEHESMAGTYLAAATIYATLFDQSPEGLPYHPDELTADDATFLQRVAWETVQEWQADTPAA